MSKTHYNFQWKQTISSALPRISYILGGCGEGWRRPDPPLWKPRWHRICPRIIRAGVPLTGKAGDWGHTKVEREKWSLESEIAGGHKIKREKYPEKKERGEDAPPSSGLMTCSAPCDEHRHLKSACRFETLSKNLLPTLSTSLPEHSQWKSRWVPG